MPYSRRSARTATNRFPKNSCSSAVKAIGVLAVILGLRNGDVLQKLPALGTKTPAELSLGAVKAFREDAIAAGLNL